MRYFHQLLPDSSGAEEDPTDPHQHVQLRPADHRNSSEHLHRNGHPHLAEGPGNPPGLQRPDNRELQPQQKSIKNPCISNSRRNAGNILCKYLLLLQEASLENDAAAVDLAVNLFRVLSEADALYLCSALDHH